MNLLLSIASILAAALAIASLALFLTFVIGPLYRASLPKDNKPRYQPSGQTHLNNHL